MGVREGAGSLAIQATFVAVPDTSVDMVPTPTYTCRMSKAVRIRDHLYAEIEALAKAERRSLIAQLEVLLEQALALDSSENLRVRTAPATDEACEEIKAPPDGTPATLPADQHFKPDFK